MANELWKPVKGFEGFYEVSSEGRVRSVDRIDARGQHRKSKIMSVKRTRHKDFDWCCGTSNFHGYRNRR